jgi:hypothetical protein
LKNRDGEAGKILGMTFIGETGIFKEMPTSKEMTSDYYEKIQKIHKSFTIQKD